MGFTPPSYIGANANRGTDSSIKIVRLDNGQGIALGGREQVFKATSKHTVEPLEGISDGGRVYHQFIPGGFHGSITILRYNGDFDNFLKQIEANAYSLGAQIECTITQTIFNKFDNSTTINTFTHCVLSTNDLGDWTRTKATMFMVEFDATERL